MSEHLPWVAHVEVSAADRTAERIGPALANPICIDAIGFAEGIKRRKKCGYTKQYQGRREKGDRYRR